MVPRPWESVLTFTVQKPVLCHETVSLNLITLINRHVFFMFRLQVKMEQPLIEENE